MQIGELARRFGIAPSKIRFLEDEGLVRPIRRTRAGYREYDEGSAEALTMILQAQSLGFTLDEIKGALAETKNHGLRRDYLIGQIARKLREIDRHIAQAQELRAPGLRQQRTQDTHEERRELRRKGCGRSNSATFLIAVSVTPAPYFFCAAADTVAAARISPNSPNDVTTALTKFVVKKSLAPRFLRYLLGYGPGLTASC